jgi:hypothetical protein
MRSKPLNQLFIEEFYKDNHWGDATTHRFACQRPLDGFGTPEEIKEQRAGCTSHAAKRAFTQ